MTVRHRTRDLVQPGRLKWEGATVVLRVDKIGRNVGLLIETANERRYFQCELDQQRRGAVALVEVGS